MWYFKFPRVWDWLWVRVWQRVTVALSQGFFIQHPLCFGLLEITSLCNLSLQKNPIFPASVRMQFLHQLFHPKMHAVNIFFKKVKSRVRQPPTSSPFARARATQGQIVPTMGVVPAFLLIAPCYSLMSSHQTTCSLAEKEENNMFIQLLILLN